MSLTITPVVHAGDDFDLDPDVVQALWRMEERHFWSRARNAWIADTLREAGVAPGARVLDVGCGSGCVAGHLASAGYQVTGVDTAEPLVRKAHERFPEVTFLVADVGRLPGGTGRFDAIGFFDVLEHVDEPSALLRASLAHGRPGAVVVATVPAERRLHTIIDDVSGHKKRYELGELGELFTSAGLVGVEERGIFRWTRPLQRLARMRYRRTSREDGRRALIENLKVPARPINAVLGAVCQLERRLAFGRAVDRAGPTIVAAARVP